MDKYIIDTSSLLNLVRYYHPFDSDKKLYNKTEEMFVTEYFLLIENVLKEAERVAGGRILKTYSFLRKEAGKIKRIKSDTAISRELHERIDKGWVIKTNKPENQEGYKEVKTREIEERADFQLVFAAINRRATVVTEESKSINDNKVFKKIPLICEHEEIPCITLPDLLKEIDIGIEYKIK